MEFKFDGRDKPYVLPDDFMTEIQYERMERHLAERAGIPHEDVRSVRECLAAVLDDDELIALTDNLPRTPHNTQEWQNVLAYIVVLAKKSTQVGDDITNGVIKGEPDDIPLDVRPPKKKRSTAAAKKKKAKTKRKSTKRK